MSGEAKCRRCGDPANTIDNVMDTSFWGALQRRTRTTVEKSIHVAATHMRGRAESVLRSDEEMPLCSPCWGEFIAYFLQGRAVAPLGHGHEWRKGGKSFDGIYLDHCLLCYRTQIHVPKPADLSPIVFDPPLTDAEAEAFVAALPSSGEAERARVFDEMREIDNAIEAGSTGTGNQENGGRNG